MSNQNVTQDTVFDDQAEAAKLLRHTERTLEKWRVRGEGPPFLKIGRRVLYDRAAVIAWARSRQRTSTSDEGTAA